jgi:hypothetical protein
LAFEVVAERHNFQKDVPSIDAGAGMIERLLAEPAHYGVAAETDGKLIGSNFVDLRSRIAGGRPISIDPEAQNAGVGRRLTDSATIGSARFFHVRVWPIVLQKSVEGCRRA